jgi:CubicO group peptidase (beta-lactamase class C family)
VNVFHSKAGGAEPTAIARFGNERKAMGSKEEMREVLTRHVERGELPGVVSLVSRRGQVQVDVIGAADATTGAPMRRDTLFRVSSMTKPVTAAAVMILVDEGTLKLDEPVDRFLPELAGRRVLRRLDGPLDDTVSAARPISVRDLLTMRMGFGIVFGPNVLPIQRAAEDLKLGAFGPPHPLEPPPGDEWIRRFATLPLMHQPGERWMYNTGIEVASLLVVRASGKPLDVFFRERIFEPLGMKDTSFFVPVAGIDRLATSYIARDPFAPDVGGYDLYDPARSGQWSQKPPFLSGAAGLVSTADDFLALGRMMLGRGAVGGTRVLSQAAVDAMTTDQLTAGQKAASAFAPADYWDNHGWGFGMAIVTGPDAITETPPGRYGWDGGLGTSWACDPGRDLVGVLMTQRCAFPPMAGVYRDFWKTAYRD